MYNPAAVNDNAGEWFELYNNGNTAVNLLNWRITDQPSPSPSQQNVFVITSNLTILPGRYTVFGFNGNRATNGNITVDFVYPSSFQLGNSDDEIILMDPANVTRDVVFYDNSNPVVNSNGGVSIALRSPLLNNNITTNWCVSTTRIILQTGANGDRGTPGRANDC
jgi:uncharacterized protein